MTDTPGTPAGWYPDPVDATRQRYWDGLQWTENRAPAWPAAPPTGPVASPTGISSHAGPPRSGVGAWVIVLIVAGVLTAVALAAAGGFVLLSSGGDAAGPAGTAATSTEPASQPTNVTLVVEITVSDKCSVIQKDSSGYNDFAAGQNVTLIDKQRRVVAASSWRKQKFQLYDTECMVTVTFDNVPNDVPVVGLDTSGTRAVYWSNVADFPLSLKI